MVQIPFHLHQDIFELAKLAEAAGVDLRIVLLTRHPSDLVQSPAQLVFRNQMGNESRT